MRLSEFEEYSGKRLHQNELSGSDGGVRAEGDSGAGSARPCLGDNQRLRGTEGWEVGLRGVVVGSRVGAQPEPEQVRQGEAKRSGLDLAGVAHAVRSWWAVRLRGWSWVADATVAVR